MATYLGRCWAIEGLIPASSGFFPWLTWFWKMFFLCSFQFDFGLIWFVVGAFPCPSGFFLGKSVGFIAGIHSICSPNPIWPSSWIQSDFHSFLWFEPSFLFQHSPHFDQQRHLSAQQGHPFILPYPEQLGLTQFADSESARVSLCWGWGIRPQPSGSLHSSVYLFAWVILSTDYFARSRTLRSSTTRLRRRSFEDAGWELSSSLEMSGSTSGAASSCLARIRFRRPSSLNLEAFENGQLGSCWFSAWPRFYLASGRYSTATGVAGLSIEVA